MNQIRTSYFCPIVMRWNVTGQLIPETLFEDRAACSSLIDTFHSCTIVVKISSMQENAPNIFPEHLILKLDHFCCIFFDLCSRVLSNWVENAKYDFEQ